MGWMNIWSYNQMDYRSWPSKADNAFQCLKIISNHKAGRLRIHFSNRYGIEPLVFDRVSVKINGGSEHPVICGGQTVLAMPAGAELVSEPVEVAVVPGDVIELTSYLKQQSQLTGGIVTYCRRELDIVHTDAASGEMLCQKEIFAMVRSNHRMSFAYGISGIDLFCPDSDCCIAVFGDSLTQQGFWVDHLKKRLRDSGRTGIAVLNRGIGGSRILKGTDPLADPYDRHGISGLERFEADCCRYGKPDRIIVFHGINDLITRHAVPSDYPFTPADIISGLASYAEMAQHLGIRIWIGTLTPLGRSVFYSEQLERERNLVNAWIRSQQCYDGVLDFDRAVCAGEDASFLDVVCDSGDGLHLSDEGGQRLAEVVEIDDMIGKK